MSLFIEVSHIMYKTAELRIRTPDAWGWVRAPVPLGHAPVQRMLPKVMVALMLNPALVKGLSPGVAQGGVWPRI